MDKFRIYETHCRSCNLKYVEQTQRTIISRFKDFKCTRFEKYSVALHIQRTCHGTKINNLNINYREINLSKVWYSIKMLVLPGTHELSKIVSISK